MKEMIKGNWRQTVADHDIVFVLKMALRAYERQRFVFLED
jgi:hypothetical protein